MSTDGPDMEGIPPRQRASDMPVGNIELILYQLSEIKGMLQKLEGRLDRFEDRIGALERFRSRQEEADRASAANTSLVNARWVPIIVLTISVLTTVILFLVGNG